MLHFLDTQKTSKKEGVLGSALAQQSTLPPLLGLLPLVKPLRVLPAGAPDAQAKPELSGTADICPVSTAEHLSCLNSRNLSCPNWCAPCGGQRFFRPPKPIWPATVGGNLAKRLQEPSSKRTPPHGEAMAKPWPSHPWLRLACKGISHGPAMAW